MLSKFVALIATVASKEQLKLESDHFLKTQSTWTPAPKSALMNQLQMAGKVSANQNALITSGINIDINNVAACQYATKTAFFNLDNIVVDEGDKDDQNQQVPATFDKFANEDIIFNFCEHYIDKSLVPALPDNCPDDGYAFIIRKTGDKQCFKLTEDADQKANTFGTELKDENGNINGIQLNYEGGSQTCLSDSNKSYNLTVKIMCKLGAVHNLVGNNGDECNPVLTYESDLGCPKFTFDKFEAFINEYDYLWGAALIAIGVFLAFFGNKFVNAVIFLVTGLVFFIVVGSLVFQMFLTDVEKEWIMWAVIVAIALVGFGLGWVLKEYRKYGVGLLAAWGGVLFGFVLTNTFFIEDKAAYWCIIVACGVVAFLLTIKVEKLVVILITAFVGSYAAVRGVSLYAGGFPSEASLHEEIKSGAVTWKTFDKTFYYYLGGIVVLFLASGAFQFKTNKERDGPLKTMRR